MKIGYKIRNGGCGTVIAIVMAQPMLIIHADISSMKRVGHSLKSRLVQLIMSENTVVN